jgi:hypothetical protein
MSIRLDQKRISVSTLTIFLFSILILNQITFTHVVHAAKAGGTIIPLFTNPTDPSWNEVAAAKDAHPSVSIVATINPANGPGTSRDMNFVNGISNLRSHGVVVIGYVFTSFASRPIADVEKDIFTYKSFYPNLNGIFFDEMSNVAGNENYYRTLSRFAYSLGFTYTVGNPGTATLPSYIGTVNTLIIYENSVLPSIDTLDASTFHPAYQTKNFGIVVFNQPTLDTNFVNQAKSFVQYIYITNGNLPNPFDSLPPYFNDLIAALDLFQPPLHASPPTSDQTDFDSNIID